MFYVIHNQRFPLRKVFIQAQFKRYNITAYQFIEIPLSGVILSTYIQLIHQLSLNITNHTNKTYCIMVDTVLITKNLLDRVQYGHFMTISCKKSIDLIFVHPISHNSQKIIQQSKTLHLDSWKWNDQIPHSSCFIITTQCAKLMIDYHNFCQDTGEYNDIDKLFLSGLSCHTLNSLDKWIYKCAIMHSNYPLRSLWIS